MVCVLIEIYVRNIACEKLCCWFSWYENTYFTSIFVNIYMIGLNLVLWWLCG